MKLVMAPLQCLPAAFSMVLNCPLESMFEKHDGMDIVAELPEPNCYRGHHIQEMIDICVERGYSVTMCDLYPKTLRGGVVEDVELGPVFDRLWWYLEHGNGVVTCKTGRGTGHALAWSFPEQAFYDPAGAIYKSWPVQYEPLQFWLVGRL